MAGSNDVVIIAGCRTPIGKFQGRLSDMTAPQLGAVVVREAVKRANLQPQQVDECIMGNVVSAGLGQNPARQASLFGGLAPAVVRDNQQGVRLRIESGRPGGAGDRDWQQFHRCCRGYGVDDECSVSVAECPQGISSGQRTSGRFHGERWAVGHLQRLPHGTDGRNLAEKYGITREEQDEFAVNSHRKAISAQKECRFKAQIVPVELPAKKKGKPPVIFDKDEGPREDLHRGPACIETCFQKGWHGDGRQCSRRQRRGGRVDCDQRPARRKNWARLRWAISWRRPPAESSRNG